MITDLWIENFKGIGKRQHIPLRPITLLFGRNSAGKSTVLHALLYLREILINHEFEPTQPLDGDHTVSLGSMKEFLHDPMDACELGLTIGIRFQPSEKSVIEFLKLFHRGQQLVPILESPAESDEADEQPKMDPEALHSGSCLAGPIEIEFTIGQSVREDKTFTPKPEDYDLQRQLKRLTISIAGSRFLTLELDPELHNSEQLVGNVNLLSPAWNGQTASPADFEFEKASLRSASTHYYGCFDDHWKGDPDAGSLVIAPLELAEMRWIDVQRAHDLLVDPDRMHIQCSRVLLKTYLFKVFSDERTDKVEKRLNALGLDLQSGCILILGGEYDPNHLQLKTMGENAGRLIGMLFPNPVKLETVLQTIDVLRALHFPDDGTAPDERAIWARRFTIPDFRCVFPSREPFFAAIVAGDAFSSDQRRASAQQVKSINTVGQIVQGSLFCLAKDLKETIYVGPKRSTVPRNLSSQNIAGCTNWGAGLASWKWLLEGDPTDIETCNDWLASTTKGLGTGYKIEVTVLREIPEYNQLKSAREIQWDLEWERDLQPFLTEESPSTDEPKNNVEDHARKQEAYLARLKEAYESLYAAYIDAPRFKRLQLRDMATSKTRHPQELGEGITQVVPVIASCVKVAKSVDFVCIEQPELHLHPSLAAKLGDLFISTMLNSQGAQALIETHSEHIILRILRRIRQTTDDELPPNGHIPPVKPDDVCVLWVDNLGDGTTIQRLRIDERGEFIDRWPKGFFSERAEELY